MFLRQGVMSESELEIDKSIYPDPDIRGLSLLDSESDRSSISDVENDSNVTSLGDGLSEYGSDSSLHMSDSISRYLNDLDPTDPEFRRFQAYLENPWSDVSDEQLDAVKDLDSDERSGSEDILSFVTSSEADSCFSDDP